MPITPVPAPATKWRDIRKAIARIITACVPENTRVHDQWKLQFDPAKTASLVTMTQGASRGRIHGYMIGIRAANYEKGDNGQPPIVGGMQFDWILDLDVWGFLDYSLGSDDANSQDIFEDEIRTISATIFTLPRLDLDSVTQQGLRRADPLEFGALDIVNFAEGVDAHFAQGAMQIRVKENF